MLSADDFYVTDEHVLARENELLFLENILLRGRPDERGMVTEATLRQAVLDEREKGRRAVRRVLDKHRADTEERRARYASVPHDRLARLQKAESDLQWLVQRLSRSPVGPLLRRWEGWRALASRWGP